MNALEFSNNFDTLLNSYDNGIAIVLNEYDKSVLLTEAQDALVKQLYCGNPGIVSFEVDEALRRQLETLVITATPTKVLPNEQGKFPKALAKGKYKHTLYTLPSDCWYIVYEEVDRENSETCESLQHADVVPVTHDDYYRTVKNSFRGPKNTRVLRLDKGEKEIELVSSFEIGESEYKIRYIKQPKPIILQILPDEASIQNQFGTETKEEEYDSTNVCELPEQLHWRIIELAAQLALTRNSQYNSKASS